MSNFPARTVFIIRLVEYFVEISYTISILRRSTCTKCGEIKICWKASAARAIFPSKSRTKQTKTAQYYEFHLINFKMKINLIQFGAFCSPFVCMSSFILIFTCSMDFLCMQPTSYVFSWKTYYVLFLTWIFRSE